MFPFLKREGDESTIFKSFFYLYFFNAGRESFFVILLVDCVI